MHHGIFVGNNARSQETRVLILGESHHTGDGNPTPGTPANYETHEVVRNDYYEKPTDKNYRFFDKMAQSFGIDPALNGNRQDFWEKVYFGNYIDVLCSVGDSLAENNINEGNNRNNYNKELFEFVNLENISVIFCFSRLVFDNLPSPDENDEIQCGKAGRQRDFISRSIYLPKAEHKNTVIVLNNQLTVYGMRHPSTPYGGFVPENYTEKLCDVGKKIKLL